MESVITGNLTNKKTFVMLLYVIDKAPFELSQRGQWQMSLIRSRHFDTNMFTLTCGWPVITMSNSLASQT